MATQADIDAMATAPPKLRTGQEVLSNGAATAPPIGDLIAPLSPQTAPAGAITRASAEAQIRKIDCWQNEQGARVEVRPLATKDKDAANALSRELDQNARETQILNRQIELNEQAIVAYLNAQTDPEGLALSPQLEERRKKYDEAGNKLLDQRQTLQRGMFRFRCKVEQNGVLVPLTPELIETLKGSGDGDTWTFADETSLSMFLGGLSQRDADLQAFSRASLPVIADAPSPGTGGPTPTTPS